MPYGNPGGYRNKRSGRGRGGRGSGTAALVNQLQAVLQRFGGGGRRGSTTQGRLGKGMRAAARGRAQRVGDDVFDPEPDEGIYGDQRGRLRVGHRM